jgi:membrane-associated phospholipid phosphatase
VTQVSPRAFGGKPTTVSHVESRRALSPARRNSKHPAAVFTLTAVAGYLVLAALAIGLGFLLVDVILPFHGFGSSDEHVNTWFAAHRDGTRNDASFVGSMMGDIPVLPVVVVIAAIVLAVRRHWLAAAFLVAAIAIEAATYRVASLVVHRERPTVPRLDHLPVNQSFPSGHVAASLAVYGGLAYLLTRNASRGWKIAAWTVALCLVAVVATSRMYRGMHHPTDVASGLLIGAGAIAVALIAAHVTHDREEAR